MTAMEVIKETSDAKLPRSKLHQLPSLQASSISNLVELADGSLRGSETIPKSEPENKPVAPPTRLELAGGEGFEPPTSGSGGLCPILARLPARQNEE